MQNEEANAVLSKEIGLNLTSEAYAQRRNESNDEYNHRLLKEVEAYLASPKIAEKLETLKKENPTLWQKIKDFITQLTNYLTTQLGLEDYSGNIMSLTKDQYLDALGVSA